MASAIVVYGGSGHGRVVIEALRAGGAYEPVAVLDPALEGEIDGVPVKGDDAAAALRAGGVAVAAIGVGAVATPPLRRRLHAAALRGRLRPAAGGASAGQRGGHRQLAPGCFVASGALVGPGARIGEGAIVNSNAVVDHDCAVGAFAHVAPGAALSGAVEVGADALVGTGAAVVQGVRIGAGAVIGAGAAVVADVPAGALAVGVPARVEPGDHAGPRVRHRRGRGQPQRLARHRARLVDAAAAAGADAVKFQSFRARLLATAAAPRAAYQRETTGSSAVSSRCSRPRALGRRPPPPRGPLPRARHRVPLGALRRRERRASRDARSARLKVPSGQLLDLPYLRRVAALGLPLIVSTGMADALRGRGGARRPRGCRLPACPGDRAALLDRVPDASGRRQSQRPW